MTLSNYPPGHPSGNGRCDVEIECEACKHIYLVPGTVEYDTNAAYPDDDADLTCPKCGHVDGEPTPSEDDDDLLDAEVARHLPAVLALGTRLADIVRADHEARLDYADGGRRVEGITTYTETT